MLKGSALFLTRSTNMTTCSACTRMREDMRILAIDPGFGRLGIALVGGNPSRPVVEMSRCVEPGRGAHERRLSRGTEAVGEAIKAHAPDALAIETLFFSTNRKTALKV